MKTLFILLTLVATALFASPDPFLPEDGHVRQRTWIDVNPVSYYNDVSSPTGAYADLTQYSYTAGTCLSGDGMRGLTVEVWIKMFADSVKSANDFMLVHHASNLWSLLVSNDGKRIIEKTCESLMLSDTIPTHTLFMANNKPVKSNNVLDGQWHLVAMTWPPYPANNILSNFKFYIDGIPISVQDTVNQGAFNLDPSNTLIVGGVQPVLADPRNFAEPGFPGHFCGEIVSDTERSASYILEHFVRFQNTISIGYRPPVAAEVITTLPLITVTSFPEPFNSFVAIRFTLDHPTQALLRVFDLQGRVVATPFSGITTGTNTAPWDGTAFPSGKYVYRLSAGSVTKAGSITLVR